MGCDVCTCVMMGDDDMTFFVKLTMVMMNKNKIGIQIKSVVVFYLVICVDLHWMST